MKTTLLTLTIALSSFLALGNTDAEARRNKGSQARTKSTRTQTRTIKRSTYRAPARTSRTRTYKRTINKIPARTYKRKTYKRNTYKRNTYKRNTYKAPARTKARVTHKSRVSRPYKQATRHKTTHRTRVSHVASKRHTRKLFRIIRSSVYIFGQRQDNEPEVALLTLTNSHHLDRIIEVRMGDNPICSRNPLEGNFTVAGGQDLKLPINGQYACYRQLQVKQNGYFDSAIGGWNQKTLGNDHQQLWF